MTAHENVALTEAQVTDALMMRFGSALFTYQTAREHARAVLELLPGEPVAAVEARVRRETLLEIARQAEATDLPPRSVLDEYLEVQRTVVRIALLNELAAGGGPFDRQARVWLRATAARIEAEVPEAAVPDIPGLEGTRSALDALTVRKRPGA